MDQEYYRNQSERMALVMRDYLLRDSSQLDPDSAVSYAVRLILDWVRHLNQIEQAIQFALNFHPLVARWSRWTPWKLALEAILTAEYSQWEASDYIRLLNHMSQTSREVGDSETASTRAKTALQLAKSIKEEALIALSLSKIGLIAINRGDVNTAYEYLQDAYIIGRDTLTNLEIGHINLDLGVICARRGELSSARTHFEQALHCYHTENEILHAAKAICNLADLSVKEGSLTEVPPSLWWAIDVFRQLGNTYEYGQAENDLGCMYLKLQKFDLALEAFEKSLSAFEEIHVVGAKIWVMSNIIELYVTTKQWDQARALIKDAIHLAEIYHSPLLYAVIKVDWGRMEAEQGHQQEAAELWLHALHIQQEQGALFAAQYTQQLLDSLAKQNS